MSNKAGTDNYGQALSRIHDCGFSGVAKAAADMLISVLKDSAKKSIKAKDILEAMKKAQESGAGAATLNGKLIDAASVRQAEQIIKQTKLIETLS